MVKLLYVPITIFLLILSSFNINTDRAEAYSDQTSFPEIKRIAHAGGGFKGDTYTNSLEALDCNFKRGFEFFEIDFSWTADNQLVCIHDWKETFSRFFAFSITEKPTLETFKFLVRNVSKYHICTLSDLADWMKKHPNTRLITDVKSDNIKALQLISKTIDDFSFRVIPQIYQPNEYEIAKKLGYKNIIWTLYKFNGSNNKVIELIDSFNLFAVTMPQIRAKENLGNVLKRKGIPTYVHTINSIEKVNEYVNNYGISEIYTDFLPPY